MPLKLVLVGDVFLGVFSRYILQATFLAMRRALQIGRKEPPAPEAAGGLALRAAAPPAVSSTATDAARASRRAVAGEMMRAACMAAEKSGGGARMRVRQWLPPRAPCQQPPRLCASPTASRYCVTAAPV